MSSNKKNFKKEKAQKIDSEEENEIIEEENDNEQEEIEEENDKDQEEIEQEENDKEQEEIEQEENEEEEENEEGKNKVIKEKDDLDERIATIGDASLKIQNIVSILSDFKAKREEGKSRSEYMSELKELCKSYYEYNDDICDLIFNLFPPNEAIEFMEASDSQKVLTIRTNSLKTKRRELAKNLIARGVNLDPLAEWSKVGLKIYSSSVPIGATPEYLSGQYMLQSASSFLPVLALDPHPGDKILDMCASPGGKTTYIGQLMKNEGLLVANDFKKERIKSLFFNIHRMGIKNSIVTNYDGREFAKLYNKFDRVLLDAPCSGLQKELILAAIDSCNAKGKGDGIIVYSTCSISVEENEWVIDYALKHRYVKCIEAGIEIGEPGLVKFREKHFHPSIANTRRIYPHIHNIDGFFIAKLKKYSDGPKIKGEIPQKENQKKKNEKENIDVDDYENNLEENSEPEDIQDQIKKGKLKDYNMNDNKKNKNKKKNKEKEDNEEDDGIFSGDEYEKVEEDIEKEAKNKKFKNDKIKNKKKENSKNNEKEKNEDIKKEKENLKNKNKNKKKDKKESKESEDEENIEEENTNKMKKEKDKKNKDIIFEEEKDEEKNEKINNKKITKENKKEKKLKEKKEEENEDINQNDKEEIKKKEKKERKESEGKEKEKEKKEEKLINKKRKASETNINNKDKSNKKKKNK